MDSHEGELESSRRNWAYSIVPERKRRGGGVAGPLTFKWIKITFIENNLYLTKLSFCWGDNLP